MTGDKYQAPLADQQLQIGHVTYRCLQALVAMLSR